MSSHASSRSPPFGRRPVVDGRTSNAATHETHAHRVHLMRHHTKDRSNTGRGAPSPRTHSRERSVAVMCRRAQPRAQHAAVSVGFSRVVSRCEAHHLAVASRPADRLEHNRRLPPARVDLGHDTSPLLANTIDFFHGIGDFAALLAVLRDGSPCVFRPDRRPARRPSARERRRSPDARRSRSRPAHSKHWDIFRHSPNNIK